MTMPYAVIIEKGENGTSSVVEYSEVNSRSAWLTLDKPAKSKYT